MGGGNVGSVRGDGEAEHTRDSDLRERAERETEWVVRERAEQVRTSLRTIELWRDEDGGGAGVREPRRPLPGGDVVAIELDSDEPDD